MFRTTALLLYLFFACLQAKGVVDSARFVHFDISNGLPSNNVYSFVKDRKGCTWFATDKGVVKYNGYSFVLYNTSSGLPSDDVWQLYADRHDRIWVFTFGSKFGYIQNGTFNDVRYKPGDQIMYISYLSESGDVVYFMSGREPSYLVFFVNGITKILPFGGVDRSGVQIDDMYMGNNQSLFVMDSAGEVYEWDILKGRDVKGLRFKAPEELKYGYRYRRQLSPADELYSFMFNGNTLYYDAMKTGVRKKPLTLKAMGADDKELIYSFNPYYLQNNCDSQSTLITNSHAYRISKDFTLVNRTLLIDLVPTRSQVAYHITDDEGTKWFTTKDDGVWMLPMADQELKRADLTSLLGNSEFLGDVDEQSYWYHSVRNTLYIVKSQQVEAEIVIAQPLKLRNVTGVGGKIFFGGESGIFELDKKNNQIVSLEHKYKCQFKIENAKSYHRSIMRSEKSVFEFVNMIKGVDSGLYSLASDFVLWHKIKKDSVISEIRYWNRFMGISVVDPYIVLFNNQELLIRNEHTELETVFSEEYLAGFGVSNIRQIEHDRVGNWYILDNEELYLLNTDLKIFRKLNFNISMRDAYLKILNDKLYIAGNFGIGFVDIRDGARFGSFNVLPNYTFGKPLYRNLKSFSLTKGGDIILQTEAGVWSFTTDKLKKMTLLRPENEPFFRLTLSYPYERQILDNDTFAIEQKNERIRLEVVNSHGKGNVTFLYRYKSSDDWQLLNSGEIFVDNLEPGKYHPILCMAKDDLWKSKVYTIYVYRYPMWWQTSTWRTIFWVSGVLLFLGMVLLTIFITRYYVAKKNERKRALTELELQAIHSQINPHFIFNTLSTALFYISRKRLDDAYTHVHRFSQLLRSYLKSSQDRYIILEEEIKMLRTYIELQQIRFEEKFEYRVYVDNKLPLANIRIPSLLLQPLVENAINHGLFHREKGGLLQLKFEQGDDNTELLCTIEDNGVGRSAAKRINESSSGKKESYGTKLTHQLLEVFKQYEHLDIKLEYIDKEFPDTGTIVTLALKNIKYVT